MEDKWPIVTGHVPEYDFRPCAIHNEVIEEVHTALDDTGVNKKDCVGAAVGGPSWSRRASWLVVEEVSNRWGLRVPEYEF